MTMLLVFDHECHKPDLAAKNKEAVLLSFPLPSNTVENEGYRPS
jgi:hypothetical protein